MEFLMKNIIVPFLIFFGVTMALVEAQANQLYILDGDKLKPVTKVEALIHLAQGQAQPVLKCTEQVLSEKATIKSKGK